MNPLDKGIGALRPGATVPGWNLLAEDVSLPAAVLFEPHMAHNLQWMQRFVDAYGFRLAPHGKTTMAPALFRRQLAAGAWGITVATAQQALVAFRHGVPRVLMANLLVGRRNLEIVAEALGEGRVGLAEGGGTSSRDGSDPSAGRSFYCLVDSAAAVEHLGHFFRNRSLAVDVLLELGPPNGRTGARDRGQEEAVLHALETWQDAVRLAGVEVYEGVLAEEADVRELLRRAVALCERLIADPRAGDRRPILSGAGSRWYDVVAEEFSHLLGREAVDVVLRPGCYLTHDVGDYRKAQERILASNPVAQGLAGGLVPALQVWGYVLSVPEPRRAILGLGKRDAAFDSGFPTPAVRFRPGVDEQPAAVPAHWKVTRMMDQHAFVEIAPEDDLRVGDMVGCDISHPCLTFDKWRQIVVVDADFRVVEVVQTFF
jgi:D-serine dehydratase